MMAKIRRISLAPANLKQKMQSFFCLVNAHRRAFCNHFSDRKARLNTVFATKMQPALIYWIVRLFPSEAAMWLMQRLRLVQLGGKHNG